MSNPQRLKPLTDEELRDLRYFIRFCDGVYYKSGGGNKLLSGSGRGAVGYLGDVFRDQSPKNTIRKALRRGFVEHKDHLWSPTLAGRAAVLKEGD